MNDSTPVDVHPASAEAFRTGRTTIYKGVTMRSRLEAGFAMWLDEMECEWEYEPKAFASEAGQYLPDFLIRDVLCVWTGGRHDLYLDVKPRVVFAGDDTARLTRRMKIILSSEPSALLAIAGPGLKFPIFGDTTLVGMVNADTEQLRTAAWTMCAKSGSSLGRTLGLSLPVWEHIGPWRDGYWGNLDA